MGEDASASASSSRAGVGLEVDDVVPVKMESSGVAASASSMLPRMPEIDAADPCSGVAGVAVEVVGVDADADWD